MTQHLHCALPRLSIRARAVLDGLLLTGGCLGYAPELATHLGLRSRFQLARFLRHEGLPPLHDLAAWTRLLVWIEQAEQSGCSLCQLAFHASRDPAACYREVKRITGRRWSELRRQGSRRLLADFIAFLSGSSERSSQDNRVRRSPSDRIDALPGQAPYREQR